MNFLIVEDNVLFAELISVSLRAEQVKIARTMAEAFRIIEKSPPNVVLLDLSLPDSAAAETMKRISDIKDRAKGAFVIVVTGDASRETREQALLGGADMFLDKYSGDIFFKELREKLKLSREEPCASQETVEKIENTVASMTGKPIDVPKLTVRFMQRVLPLLQPV